MLNADFDSLPPNIREYVPSCPGCTPETLRDESARPCSFYDCPGLPVELEVTCNTCMYDFVAEDGKVDCDHAVCETALRLQANVGTYKAWLKHLQTKPELP